MCVIIYLWRADDSSESGESIVQEFVIDFSVQSSDEQVRANVHHLLIVTRLVHLHRLSEQFHLRRVTSCDTSYEL